MISSYKICLACHSEIEFVEDEIYVGRKARYQNFPARKSIMFHNRLIRRSVRFCKGKILKRPYFKDTIEAMCKCVYANSHGPMRINNDPQSINKTRKIRKR